MCEIVVISLLSFDYVEFSVWVMYEEFAGILNDARVRPVVENKMEEMNPG